jgi:tetraether lipid synthase
MNDTYPIATRGLCPTCGVETPARLIPRDGDVFLVTACAEHGEAETFFWRDADLYLRLHRDRTPGALPAGPLDLARGDADGFVTTYALDVTVRCNMRCPTCVSGVGEQTAPDPLAAELIARVPDHRGDRFPPNLALVGGESTLREDLPEIIAAIKAKGVEPRLNTNGVRLAEDGYIQRLAAAGLRWVILQFDGLTPEPSLAFRNQDVSALKFEVIEKLASHGLFVHLAVMVDREVNADQLGDILRFAARTPHVRRVSFYPRSHIGRVDEKARAGTHLADLIDALEQTTAGQVTRADLLASGRLGRRLFRLTGHPMFRRRACILPFVTATASCPPRASCAPTARCVTRALSPHCFPPRTAAAASTRALGAPTCCFATSRNSTNSTPSTWSARACATTST